jgi:hypothetical protein
MRTKAVGWDITIIEVVGLLAAALAAATAVRNVQGTSTPYGLPVALAVLKLPMGALTALLGLLLMRGDSRELAATPTAQDGRRPGAEPLLTAAGAYRARSASASSATSSRG